MIGLELPPWVVAMHIIAVLHTFAVMCVVIFWTPLYHLLPLLPRYYYRRWRWRSLLAAPSVGWRTCAAGWYQYQIWVELALAWRLGTNACRERAAHSRFPGIHRFIYCAVATSTPFALVVEAGLAFVDLTADQISQLAQYVSCRLLNESGVAPDVSSFLRAEQELLKHDSKRWLEHADRLADRFGFWPFAVPRPTVVESEP